MIYNPGENVYNYLNKKLGVIASLINTTEDQEFYIVRVHEDYEIWNSYHLHGLSEWKLLSPYFPNADYVPFQCAHITDQYDTLWRNEKGQLLQLRKGFKLSGTQFLNIVDGTTGIHDRIMLGGGRYTPLLGNPKI